MDMYCPIHSDDGLARLVTPPLCFLYRVANHGHALEASIGIPNSLCWFSTPDLFVLQVFEAALLLMLLFLLIVPSLLDIIQARSLRGWDWKTDFRLVGGIGLTVWLEFCLVSISTCWAGSLC